MAPVGLVVAAASFAVFRGLHRGLELLPTPRLVEARDRWTWRNICASLVHSLLAGTGAVLWMSQYCHLVLDVTHSCPPRTGSLVSLSIGYFLADGVDILWNQTFSQSWYLLCHHAMAVSCLGVAVLPGHCLSVSVVPLLLEVNSACLHIRTLLLLSGQTSALIFHLACWATLVTLLVFRLLPLGWMSLQLLWQHHRFPLAFSVLWGVGLFTISIMSIMLVLDLLFQRPVGPGPNVLQKEGQTWGRLGGTASIALASESGGPEFGSGLRHFTATLKTSRVTLGKLLNPNCPPKDKKKKTERKPNVTGNVGGMIVPGFCTEKTPSASDRIRLGSWSSGSCRTRRLGSERGHF
ncbi:LOW QUALITY PROTEIN: TLC domain-containing protein 2 [Petaurus breviceps papuanus]|uniref:LOW QUALITY PROTEIN: TLC domain-containing protein 2 n=1 Tax=Petaurus breviceps papuanus TaxID=3040969 RepID=UPI0036DB5E42